MGKRMWRLKLKKALKKEKTISLGELFLISGFFMLFFIFTAPLLIKEKDEWKGVLLATTISLVINFGFYSLGTLFFNSLYSIIFGLLSTYIFTFLVFFLGDLHTCYKEVKLTKSEVRDYRINRVLNGRIRRLFRHRRI